MFLHEHGVSVCSVTQYTKHNISHTCTYSERLKLYSPHMIRSPPICPYTDYSLKLTNTNFSWSCILGLNNSHLHYRLVLLFTATHR